jgi:hypothetical protein
MEKFLPLMYRLSNKHMSSSEQLGAAEYLGHQLLLRLQDTKGHIPRSVFLKTWCIASRYLEDEFDYDSGVPRYWYRYGEIVDETSINGDFYYRRTTPYGLKYQPVYDISAEDFDVPRDERHQIETVAESVVGRFGKRNTRAIKEHQYTAYAPNEFIRTYSELRDYLEYTKLDEQTPLMRFRGFESNEEVVEHLLDQMSTSYPDGRFEEMKPLYLRWDDTVRMILDQGPDYDLIESLLDSFIEALSQSVIQFEFNSNLPEERIERWSEEVDDAVDDFRQDLERERNRVLENRDSSGILNQISEEYDSEVNSEIEDLLSSPDR